MKYKISYNKKYDFEKKFKDAIEKYPNIEKGLDVALQILFYKPKAGNKYYPEIDSKLNISYNLKDDFRFIQIDSFNLIYRIIDNEEVEIIAFEKCTYTCCT